VVTPTRRNTESRRNFHLVLKKKDLAGRGNLAQNETQMALDTGEALVALTVEVLAIKAAQVVQTVEALDTKEALEAQIEEAQVIKLVQADRTVAAETNQNTRFHAMEMIQNQIAQESQRASLMDSNLTVALDLILNQEDINQIEDSSPKIGLDLSPRINHSVSFVKRNLMVLLKEKVQCERSSVKTIVKNHTLSF